MHGEVLIAIYPSRAAAERARDELRKLDVPAGDIGLSADVPTATAEAADGPTLPSEPAGFFDRFFESGVPDYDRNRYDSDLGGNGPTVVAVRLDRGGVDRERIADALDSCNPLGLEGDTAATATENDLIEPEPAGLAGRRIDGMPDGSAGDAVSSSVAPARPRPLGRRRVRSYPIEPSGRRR